MHTTALDDVFMCDLFGIMRFHDIEGFDGSMTPPDKFSRMSSCQDHVDRFECFASENGSSLVPDYADVDDHDPMTTTPDARSRAEQKALDR